MATESLDSPLRCFCGPTNLNQMNGSWTYIRVSWGSFRRPWWPPDDDPFMVRWMCYNRGVLNMQGATVQCQRSDQSMLLTFKNSEKISLILLQFNSFKKHFLLPFMHVSDLQSHGSTDWLFLLLFSLLLYFFILKLLSKFLLFIFFFLSLQPNQKGQRAFFFWFLEGFLLNKGPICHLKKQTKTFHYEKDLIELHGIQNNHIIIYNNLAIYQQINQLHKWSLYLQEGYVFRISEDMMLLLWENNAISVFCISLFELDTTTRKCSKDVRINPSFLVSVPSPLWKSLISDEAYHSTFASSAKSLLENIGYFLMWHLY